MNTEANDPTENRYAPPRANVTDVSDETFEVADRAVRFGAYLLDVLIGGVLVYVPLMFGAGLSIFAAGSKSLTSLIGPGVLLALAGLIVWIVLTIRFVSANGQSIGKKLIGIRVVRSDGSKAGLGRIFWLRNVVNGLLNAIPILGSIYVLVDHLFIFGEDRRCLHDKIADTIVVKA